MEYLIVTSAVDGSTASAWNQCLDAASLPTHHTAPEFFNANHALGKRPFAVLALDRDVVHGVLTGTDSASQMDCGHSGSPRICIRRGVDIEEVGRVLAAGLRTHAAASSVQFVTAYAWDEVPGFGAEGFRRRKFEVPLGTILLDLSQGKDSLFRRCADTGRNKIRQAIKAGVEVAEMNIEKEFAEYYELYRDWCAFKNFPCEPFDQHRAYLEIKGVRLILVARYQGRMVGVSIFGFRKPGIVEYAGNVSRREETKIRPNDLLLWRAIEWSAEQGGFSHLSTGAAHAFMQKFGGEVHATYRYSLDLTLLRRRDAAEGLHAVALRVYHRLPAVVRTKAKKLISPS